MSHETGGIAVAQFAPSASREGNLADIADLARVAAIRGASVVVFPEYSSCFVDPFDSSRGENTLFLAAPDHPPPLGVGQSIIVDPQGVTLAQVGTATESAVAHVDRSVIARVRHENPALELRRFRVRPR